MIKYLQQESEFQGEIKEGLVLVDFYADWCGPCQMLAPIIEQLDKEQDLKVVKINTDDFPEVARAFRIMSIPTILLFKDGKLVKKDLGYMPIERLRDFVNKI